MERNNLKALYESYKKDPTLRNLNENDKHLITTFKSQIALFKGKTPTSTATDTEVSA